MQFLLSLGVAVYFVNLVIAKDRACERNIRTLDEYQRIINGELVQEGHCFSHPMTKASFIQIVAGARDYGGFFGKPDHAQVRWGEELHFHPSYMHYDNREWVRSRYSRPIDSNGFQNHDLALIEIDEPFDFSNKYVAPIPLRHFEGNDWLDKHANSGEITCTLAGWGRTAPVQRSIDDPLDRYLGGEKAVIALKANLTLQPLVECSKFRKYNKTTMICAFAPCKDSCHGDSGGPFICYFEKNEPPTLTAVVSFGPGCAPKTFGSYYARLDNAETWIRAMIGDELFFNGVARRVRAGFAAVASALVVLLNF